MPEIANDVFSNSLVKSPKAPSPLMGEGWGEGE
jgi:hypothetical protein